MKKIIDFLLKKIMLISLSSQVLASQAMPIDFVRLTDIDPGLIESQRYAGSHNFLGRPVPGYLSMGIYGTKRLAMALKQVNAALRKKGYTLVVYDAYRPQRAVNAFIDWSRVLGDEAGQSHYYPTVPKNKLFSLGYLAEKSSHSRGSTVDVTLISLHQRPRPITVSTRELAEGNTIPFLDDNTVDMGSSFDLFHPASHYACPWISPEQRHMRELLFATMTAHGFAGIKEEWWHYTLSDEPYPETYFDFIPQGVSALNNGK